MHIFLILLCVIVIVAVQLRIYSSTKNLIDVFKNIFPDTASKNYAIYKQDGGRLAIVHAKDYNDYKDVVNVLENTISQEKSELAQLRKDFSYS